MAPSKKTSLKPKIVRSGNQTDPDMSHHSQIEKHAAQQEKEIEAKGEAQETLRS